jgi:tetratricopeptide (TPR) repeat protein
MFWGMLDNAIADYGRCIELNEYPADSYLCRGELRRQSKNFKEAIDDLTKAYELGEKVALAKQQG